MMLFFIEFIFVVVILNGFYAVLVCGIVIVGGLLNVIGLYGFILRRCGDGRLGLGLGGGGGVGVGVGLYCLSCLGRWG
jgi:hypothetical protein